MDSDNMATPVEPADPFWSDPSGPTTLFGARSEPDQESSSALLCPQKASPISTFERIVITCPPILESLVSQLPTCSLFNLSQTSHRLRGFLHAYPLAWKSLSFRLQQREATIVSPGTETPDPRDRQAKQYNLDFLLTRVVLPVAGRLTNLDLCNTAVSGVALVAHVLQQRYDTLQHLSVRGCKNVSIKYHLLPFLHLHNTVSDPFASTSKLALKSLYTYRCRHHRRRPYLPASLLRRDSDSEPTHMLIELCHEMGIWTDTAWCPTPGPRCLRRKDYQGNRAPGTLEVWVPFDRLWRSGNRIGPANYTVSKERNDGKLWEERENGYDGEALGPAYGPFLGEGKDVPTHLRNSHKTFVDGVKCHECDELILERCETCSIKMHCMGCRKTLCASCAFDQPLPRRFAKPRSIDDSPSSSDESPDPGERPRRRKNKFWWAPGTLRSPNLMTEPLADDSDSDIPVVANNGMLHPPNALKLNMQWCCLEPMFSGGGAVAFLGPGLAGAGSDRIRAVPLPKEKAFFDPDFVDCVAGTNASMKKFLAKRNQRLLEEILGPEFDIVPYLLQSSLELQANICPRSLCGACYRSFRWKVNCKACQRPLCKEHDFRALKIRKCGWRDLSVDRELLRSAEGGSYPPDLQIPEYRESNRDSYRGSAPSETNGPIESWEASNLVRPATPVVSSNQLASVVLPQNQPDINILDDDSFNSPLSFVSPIYGSSVTSDDLIPNTQGRIRQRSASMSNLASLNPPSDKESLTQLLARDRTRLGNVSPWLLRILDSSSGRMSRLMVPCNPGHPVQWRGCGSYFCQAIRSVGDPRQRCTDTGKECRECNVYVCQLCVKTLPPRCSCAFCQSNFHCGICVCKPSVLSQCTREEERRLELRKREDAENLRRVEKHGRDKADEIAFWGNEFWVAVRDEEVMEDPMGGEGDLVDLAGA